jgi:hypothetical protein
MDSGTIFLLLIFLTPLLALLVYGIANRKQELTGPAAVVSKRLKLAQAGGWWSENWNRLVTFRLSDGNELELYVTQAEYEELTEGLSGQLTWDKDILIHFDPANGENL